MKRIVVFFLLIMARISEQTIEQIRTTADIYEIVSEYVQLNQNLHHRVFAAQKVSCHSYDLPLLVTTLATGARAATASVRELPGASPDGGSCAKTLRHGLVME